MSGETPAGRPADGEQSDERLGNSGFSALYPFLCESAPSAAETSQVLAEVRESTVRKAREILALRQRVAIEDGARVEACAAAMAERFAAGGRLLVFGNGGSATDAADLARLFLCPGAGRRGLPAIALANDIAAVTALTNDVGFDVAFARQIAAFAQPGDIAAGLSTSGNSANLLQAFDQAKRLGMLTIGLAGYDGGKMAGLASIDHLFVVPSSSVHRVQEAQTTIYHVLWELTSDAGSVLGARASLEVTP